ncbi:Bacterial lipid A biosynthesis acyltransferase [seawater metagenome]|uniref:Bacterial lipid A biosynthesis acyltransferase n=1 Tax=seawater metagenome TaxID=1561972 RepID=A0A5E8CIV2_9ZZZZ
MYIKILLFLGIILFFIKKIYTKYFLIIIDSIASFLTYIIIFINYKNRISIIHRNLDLVFQNKIHNKKEITFKVVKLSLINLLIAIQQNYILKSNCLLPYYNISIPPQLKEDIKTSKCIFALAHYGIFYDFATAHLLLDNMACVYKFNNPYIEKLVFSKSIPKTKIFPIKHTELNKFYKNNQPIMTIPCDQKGASNKNIITFLNQETNFHSSVNVIQKITKRSVWIYLCYYDFEQKKIIPKIIPVHRKNLNSKNLTQSIADIFSKEILNNPEQYFWLHNRFNLSF